MSDDSGLARTLAQNHAILGKAVIRDDVTSLRRIEGEPGAKGAYSAAPRPPVGKKLIVTLSFALDPCLSVLVDLCLSFRVDLCLFLCLFLYDDCIFLFMCIFSRLSGFQSTRTALICAFSFVLLWVFFFVLLCILRKKYTYIHIHMYLLLSTSTCHLRLPPVFPCF